MLAPTGTPSDVIDRLNALVVKVVNAPETKDMLQKQGFESQTGTPEQLAERIRREITRNAELIKMAGLKPE